MTTSRERVLRALAFEAPDRIPRFESFWDYGRQWQSSLGPLESWNDVKIWVPDEGTYPSRAGVVIEDTAGGTRTCVDSWGRTIRTRTDAYFQEVLQVPFPEDADIDRLPPFDPADADSRYEVHGTAEQTLEALRRDKERFCVFGKIGGLFHRSTQVRGFQQFLMDLSADRVLAGELVQRMYEHRLAIALEQLRRWDLADTGIWVYDDIAYNSGPLLSPLVFEAVFLERYERLVSEIKGAGASYVIFHSDGDITPLLDMLVAAGFDGIHPVERRAGMDPVALRRRYPALRFFGGMDNANLLRTGTPSEIERETKRVIDLGRDGGLVIGSHSIGPDVPVDRYAQFHRCCLEYGRFRT